MTEREAFLLFVAVLINACLTVFLISSFTVPPQTVQYGEFREPCTYTVKDEVMTVYCPDN